MVDFIYSSTDRQRQLKKSGLARRSALIRTARDLRCSVQEVEDALKEIESGYPLYGATPEGGDLRVAEYHALIEPIRDVLEDEDFVTRHRTAEWKALGKRFQTGSANGAAAVSRLIEVRRLREIVVLRGFARLGSDHVIPPDITGETGWLPSVALRGEGIFFTLECQAVEAWERQKGLEGRAAAMKARCEAYPLRNVVGPEEVSPRFVLLHTLAHLVIRQLEAESGYPSASLKERIYSSTGPEPMAGILIYVAVPDDIGSMGGLAELAAPRRFLRILSAALESATWCSLDPICSEHEGQGPGLLNGAACQACTLVADTTCQYRNALLDRTFVKGNEEHCITAFPDFARSKP